MSPWKRYKNSFVLFGYSFSLYTIGSVEKYNASE